MTTESASERYQRLKKLLQQALDLPDAERHQFILDHCPDLTMQQELLAMLEDVESDTDELLTGAAGHLKVNPAQMIATLPNQIGPYQVLEKLGEGGMGMVISAQQEQPIKRQVAIKLMQAMHHQGARDRFVREYQALARLSHPNVAALYSLDFTADDQPYAVMELVHGLPITQYADANRLDLSKRIELLCQVCSGIAHAHEKNILHYDIKPTNLLVGEYEGRPLTKVIDFGIARALDESDPELAKTRELAYGSPAYLSPERVIRSPDWRPDTRTDVYALGVTAYELLVGTRPFDDAGLSIHQLAEKLIHDDPPRPSDRWRRLGSEQQSKLASKRSENATRIQRKLSGDLDAILLKAIARRPEGRYGTPVELAADLRRYLVNIPVEARPASKGYLLRRFIRRHLAVASLVSGLLLVLSAGIVTTTLEANRANREKELAQQALAESQELSEFLANIFRQADPERLAADDLSIIELLDQASESIDEKFVDQPGAKANLLVLMGGIYGRIGQYERAEPMVLEGISLLQQPEADIDTLTEAWDELSVIYRNQGRFDQAAEAARQLVNLGEQLDDPLLKSRGLNTLGNVQYQRGEIEEALTNYLQVRDIKVAQLGPDHLDTAMADNNVGSMLMVLYRYEEAAEYFDRAHRAFRDTLPAGHPWRSGVLSNLGTINNRLGNIDQALAYSEQAVKEKALRLPPDHPSLQQSEMLLAVRYQERGRTEKALQMLHRLLEMREAQYGVEHVNTADVAVRVASVYYRSARFKEAEKYGKQAYYARVENLGLTNRRTLSALGNLVEALLKLDEVGQARELIEHVWTADVDIDDTYRLTLERLMAQADHQEGLLDKAEKRLQQIIAEDIPNRNPNSTVLEYYRLGLVHMDMGNHQAAEQDFLQALKISLSRYGETHYMSARMHHALGDTYQALGQIKQAADHYEKTMAIRNVVLHEGHPDKIAIENIMKTYAPGKAPGPS